MAVVGFVESLVMRAIIASPARPVSQQRRIINGYAFAGNPIIK
jgi:hypothetical protein